ncbi:RNA-binding S4 domain-containing protein [Nesterenkonia ebinurensis]|uniref:RNA-binding S4 domain-containing protein n=1 Tax=Nesterenkonia ebinurensis TaxID=2608252 RepID=UPI00123D5310|nr:RNA-binding S4 domain-containing protein [Nesterenkonia ebinurensis]
MSDGPVAPVRVDAWLWAVRMFKTRSAATEACRAGKVKIDGDPVKPALKISPGVRLHVSRPGFVVILEVVHTHAKRVGAPVARLAYQDHSPEQLKPREVGLPIRERGTGRPTKRERRQLELLRGYTKDH